MARTRKKVARQEAEKSRKKGKSNKKKKANNKLAKNLAKDLKQSGKLAEANFDISDLSRVDASRPTEIQNLLNQHQALSDPFSSAYAGGRSDQLQDYVGRLNDFTQGYDSRELNALREQRRREIERGFQSGRASLLRSQGNLRLGATQQAAQLARLARDYGTAGADAENDLFVQGADEKRRALTQYGDTVRGLESDEFNRGQQALANYSTLLNQARADELDRQKINLGQEAADRAAQNASKLGLLQILEARRNARQQNKLIKQGYKSNERIAGGSSRGPTSGGGGQTSTPGSSYAEELAKIAEEFRP